MAKGKRSTALFDVMHAARKPVSDPPGGFAMPKWWGKRSAKSAPSAPTPAFVPPAPPAPVLSAPEPPMIEEPIAAPQIKPSMRIMADVPAANEPLHVDPVEREVRFKLSYGGAAAAAFVLLVILLIAYLIGTRSQPVEVGKINLTAPVNTQINESGLLAAVTPTPTTPDQSTSAAITPAPARSAGASVSAVASPAIPSVASREIGKHYVIAQSYPDRDIAVKACDVLNKAGIQCTVIQGLPGWASPSWYSVVGTRAFDHIQNNPDLNAYEDAIRTAGAQFAGKSIFNRVDPKEYKWRALADQADVVQ